MRDLFDEKNISPILLNEVKEPFDDEDYIYELKLDGIRCVAYVEPKSVTLQNKRFKDLTDIYPELSDICKCVKKRVILDGELVVLTDGKPDFYALQKRSLMGDKFRISLAAKKNPVQFVAYDILYFDGKDLTELLATEQELNALHAKGYISDMQYRAEKEKVLDEIKSREATIQALQSKKLNEKKFEKSAVFTNDIADFLIQATVKDWTVTFEFMNGVKITKSYTNGRAGNVNGKLCKHKA